MELYYHIDNKYNKLLRKKISGLTHIMVMAVFLIISVAAAGEPFVAPHNLSVEISDNTSAQTHLSWSFSNPDDGSFLGFTIYRNGTAINSTLIQNTEYYDNYLSQGTYRYTVTAQYQNGESLPSNRCIVTISDDYYFPNLIGNPLHSTWTLYVDHATLGDVIVSPGDEIAIYDGTTIVGRHKFLLPPDSLQNNLSNNGLVAFSDIDITGGYTPGNSYTFKLWDASSEILYLAYEYSFSQNDPNGYTGNVFPDDDNAYSIIYLSFVPDLPSTSAPTVSSQQHDILLSWQEPQHATRDLLGYDVYRNNEKINSYPISSTVYTDNAVPSGEYDYFITCVYDEGVSAPSPTSSLVLSTVYFSPYGDVSSAPSTMSATILSAGIMNTPLEMFDEIAVYNNTTCIAAISLVAPITTSLNIDIPEDNPDTPELDGFTLGDTLCFYIYDYDQSIEYNKAIATNQNLEEEIYTYLPNEIATMHLNWLPYAPVNLSSSVNEYDVHLQWEESDDNPSLTLLGYDVYRDNEKINTSTVNNTFFNDNNLFVDEYKYKVLAIYQQSVSRFSEEHIVTIPTQTFVPTQEYNPDSMLIKVFAADIDDVSLADYDEIGVFCYNDAEEEEVCCGAASLKATLSPDNPINITAWKDNAATTVKDGYAEGDSIRYKLWKKETDNIYNTVIHSFVNASGSPYNLHYFTTDNTTEVELHFTTPPPVAFSFVQDDACAGQDNAVHIITHSFNQLNSFVFIIHLDTSYLTYNYYCNINSSLVDYHINNQQDVITITWHDDDAISIDDNDTIISLNFDFLQKGNTAIVWDDDSQTTGMEYQESVYTNISLLIDSIPTSPSAIFGDQDVCNGTLYSIYSVSVIDDATDYIWNIIPTEAGSVEGNMNSATLSWNNTFEGQSTISVQPANQCGVSDVTTKNINITNSVYISAVVSADTQDKCEGEDITVNASITNGGNNPLVMWYINNEYQYGINDTSFVTNELQHDDEVYCILHSDSECALNNPFTSNTITSMLSPLPLRPTITAGPDTICSTTTQSTYITSGSDFSDTYNWKIIPEEAGTIIENNQSAYVQWNTNYLGMSYIFVRGSNDCGNGLFSTSYNTYRDYCTDNNMMKKNTISIYPNPVKETMQIILPPNTFNACYQIFDNKGIAITQQQPLPNNNHINTKPLPTGLYFININGITLKFLKID